MSRQVGFSLQSVLAMVNNSRWKPGGRAAMTTLEHSDRPTPLTSRVPPVPLGRFLDDGGKPEEWLSGPELFELARLARSAWSSERTPAHRNRVAFRAIRRYLSESEEGFPRRSELTSTQVANLWTADLLRDRSLLNRFTAQLD